MPDGDLPALNCPPSGRATLGFAKKYDASTGSLLHKTIGDALRTPDADGDDSGRYEGSLIEFVVYAVEKKPGGKRVEVRIAQPPPTLSEPRPTSPGLARPPANLPLTSRRSPPISPGRQVGIAELSLEGLLNDRHDHAATLQIASSVSGAAVGTLACSVTALAALQVPRSPTTFHDLPRPSNRLP